MLRALRKFKIKIGNVVVRFSLLTAFGILAFLSACSPVEESVVPPGAEMGHLDSDETVAGDSGTTRLEEQMRQKVLTEGLVATLGKGYILDRVPDCQNFSGLVRTDLDDQYSAQLLDSEQITAGPDAHNFMLDWQYIQNPFETTIVAAKTSLTFEYSEAVGKEASHWLREFLAEEEWAEGLNERAVFGDFFALLIEECDADGEYLSTVSSLESSKAEFDRILALSQDYQLQIPRPTHSAGDNKSFRFNGFSAEWVSGESSPCSGCSYWTLEISPENVRCAGVYSEVNIYDASGRVVDWSNDWVPSLRPGEVARLQFQSYVPSAQKARLVNLSCH